MTRGLIPYAGSERRSVNGKSRLGPSSAAARNMNILERLDHGETLQSVADDFGLTRERVRQIMVASGRTPRFQVVRELNQLRSSLVLPLVEQGRTYTEIAAETGLTTAEIGALCRSVGVKVPRMPASEVKRLSDLAAKVEAGASIRSLALGDRVEEARIAKFCRERGITSAFKKSGEPRQRSAIKRTPPVVLAGAHAGEDLRSACMRLRGHGSATQIASALGVSRNAVIGHWFRGRRDAALNGGA